jgi:CRP-like cAMP-binding protein
MTMRVTRDFLRGRGRDAMSESDKDILERAVDRIDTLPARTIVTRRGDRLRNSTLLLEGAMCRYMDARDGFRQLVALQVPGDFVDLHGYPLQRLDHDVGTLTEARVAMIPHAAIDSLDAALHREWIFRIGRLDAAGRIAHFLLETYHRLKATGRGENGAFELALIQQDLGEACGLTSVHVNRTLRRLREEKLVEAVRGTVTILDEAGLARVGEYDPDYLYLEDGPWQAAAA